MKISLPWWHRLLQPYFNWRADVREKAAAEKRLREFQLLGYFAYHTDVTDRGYRLQHTFAAYKNARGERKLVQVHAEHPWPLKTQDRDHAYYVYVAAWLNGDDSMERLLQAMPTSGVGQPIAKKE